MNCLEALLGKVIEITPGKNPRKHSTIEVSRVQELVEQEYPGKTVDARTVNACARRLRMEKASDATKSNKTHFVHVAEIKKDDGSPSSQVGAAQLQGDTRAMHMASSNMGMSDSSSDADEAGPSTERRRSFT